MSEDPAVSPSVDAEFVTVVEAARRLGIGERQAHRLAHRLATTDIVSDQVGRQVRRRVRLSAMYSLRGGTMARLEESDQSQHDVRPGQTRTDAVSVEVVDLRARLESAELRIADKNAEIARLSAALTREQETASKLADRLADADARLAAVLVRQLPPADTGGARDAPRDAQEPESGARGTERGKGGTEEKRPWWWWRR